MAGNTIQPFTVNQPTIDGNLTVYDDGTGAWGIVTARQFVGSMVASVAPTGDQTGIKDTAAVQALLTAGIPNIVFAPGNYYFNTALQISAICHISGAGTGVTTLNTVSNNLWDFGNNFLNGQPSGGFEMDHLSMVVNTGHCFTNPNLKQASFHDLSIIVNSASSSWWNQPQNLLVDITFRNVQVTVHGATRTVPGFTSTQSVSGNLADVHFVQCTFTNADGDNTQYAVYAACTGANAHGNAVTFDECYFEGCYGGCAQILSVTGCAFRGCSVWDINTPFTVGNSLFSIGSFSGSTAPTGTVFNGIRRSKAGPNGTTTFDISLDATVLATTIASYTSWDLVTDQVFFNFNSCADVTIIECGSESHSSTLSITNPAQKQIIINGDAGIAVQNSTSSRGSLINAIQNVSGPGSPGVNLQGVGGGDRAMGALISGDTNQRYGLAFNGTQTYGPGGATPADCTSGRLAAGVWGLTSTDFAVDTAGRGLQVKEGSNAKQGVTAAMTAGSVTVANTSVTANSRISYWRATAGGTLGHISKTQTAGTGFTLTSSSGTETSTFEYEIFEPAP